MTVGVGRGRCYTDLGSGMDLDLCEIGIDCVW